MEPKIVFEDEQILLIDKPAGMVVNKADTTKDTVTVQDWLEKAGKVSEVSEVSKGNKAFDTFDTFSTFDTFRKRAGIVHRIDKETSGLLLIAKTEEAFINLQAQFKERIVKKRYLALVHGKLEQEEGEINAPVGRLPWNRERFGVFPDGKEAKTKYRIVKSYKFKVKSGEEDLTLVELAPETGRTHQIRVHMQFLGHALVGDEFYAGRKTARDDREWCPRIFLHAAYISFIHPETDKLIEFNCELPTELQNALESLKIN
jgi:23S rRNA pseudouridine1911/1915/1917 synthase